MVKIGSRTIDTNVFLAPMSGCSDLPFRLIAREHGARFAFLEMLDANSFQHNSRRSYSMMRTDPRDKPIAAQLVGNEPESMLKAAEKILKTLAVELIDINAACPAKKVLKKRAGAYLLRDQTMLYKIVKRLAAELPVPVTVKLRTGYDDAAPQDMRDISLRCEESGAGALFIHGRTRLQAYSGDIDYPAIKRAKDSVRIPVFGSGNVFTPQLAEKMMRETGCDGVLVARGAFGNPWLADDISRYLKSGQLPPERDLALKRDVLRRHMSYIDKYNQSRGKVGVMRKVVMWYLKSFPNARRLRGDISLVKRYDEMLKFIDRIDTRKESLEPSAAA